MAALSTRRAAMAGDTQVGGVDAQPYLEASHSRRSSIPLNRRSTAPAHAPPLLLSALPISPSSRRPLPPSEAAPVPTSPSVLSSPPSLNGRISRPSSRAAYTARTPISPRTTSAPILCSSPAPDLTLDELSMEPLSLLPTLPTDLTSALPPSSPVQPLRSLESSPERRQKSSRTLSEYALAAMLAQASNADSLLGLGRRVLSAEGGGSGVMTPREGAVGLKSNKQVLAPLKSSRRTMTLTSMPQLTELTERA